MILLGCFLISLLFYHVCFLLLPSVVKTLFKRFFLINKNIKIGTSAVDYLC